MHERAMAHRRMGYHGRPPGGGHYFPRGGAQLGGNLRQYPQLGGNLRQYPQLGGNLRQYPQLHGTHRLPRNGGHPNPQINAMLNQQMAMAMMINYGNPVAIAAAAAMQAMGPYRAFRVRGPPPGLHPYPIYSAINYQHPPPPQSYNSRLSSNSAQTSGNSSSAGSITSPQMDQIQNSNGSITSAENGGRQQHQDGGAGNMPHQPSQSTTPGTAINGNGSATPTDNGSGYNDRPGGSGGKSQMGLLGEGADPMHHERHQYDRERYHANIRPRGVFQAVSRTNLYIRGLTPETTDKDLHALCSPYGVILSTKAILDKETNKCRGYGFVDFAHEESADTAIKLLGSHGVQAQKAKCSEGSRKGGGGGGGSSHSSGFGGPKERSGGNGGYYSGDRASGNYGGGQGGLNDCEQFAEAVDHDPTNLYIANLPININESDLEKMLSAYGSVVSTRILKDTNGFSRGVGFARMETKEKCEEIIQILNSKKVSGSNDPLLVKFADGGGKKKHYKNDGEGGRGGGGRYRNDGDQIAMQYDSTNIASNGSVAPQMLPSGLGQAYQRVFSAAAMGGGMPPNAAVSAANVYHGHQPQQQTTVAMPANNPWMVAAAAAAAQAGGVPPQYMIPPQMLPPDAAMHAAYSPALMHQLNTHMSQLGLGGPGYMAGNPHAYGGQAMYPPQMMQMQMPGEQQPESLNQSQSVSSGSASNEDHSAGAAGVAYQPMYQQQQK